MIDYTPKQKTDKVKRFGKGPMPARTLPRTAVVTSLPIRSGAIKPMRSISTPGHSTALKPSPCYTGDLCVGISQMAKSNAVPVFNSEAITDIARMRR